MAEHSIIFTGDSPALIVAGQKTQDRRVMRPQPVRAKARYGGGTWAALPGGGFGNLEHTAVAAESCPYGQPGDWLWISEAWAQVYVHGDGCSYSEEPCCPCGDCRPDRYIDDARPTDPR